MESEGLWYKVSPTSMEEYGWHVDIVGRVELIVV
jgi:hypothetical protein